VTIRAQLSSDEAKQVVLDLGAAINDESFQTARLYVADDMEYEGPFCTRVGAEAYLEEIERLRLKFRFNGFLRTRKMCVSSITLIPRASPYSPAVGFRSKTERSPPLR
jgi:hypothetical protein